MPVELSAALRIENRRICVFDDIRVLSITAAIAVKLCTVVSRQPASMGPMAVRGRLCVALRLIGTQIAYEHEDGGFPQHGVTTMAEVLHHAGQRTADHRLDEMDAMTNQELLEAIWSLEAAVRGRTIVDDHRKHLTRAELEQVYRLMNCRLELQSRTEPSRAD